jgi:uncharacterized membrane protein YkvI
MLIPSVVWLSVVFGAATGTGREIVEFLVPAGAWGGIVTICVITLVYTVGFFLCFELARIFKAYDYQLLSTQFLGKFWPAYEVAVLLAMVLSLAIVSTASGEIFFTQFRLPRLWGVVGLLTIVIVFTYYGRVFIEKTMALTSMLLVMTFIYMGFQIIGSDEIAISDTFASSEVHFRGVTNGLIYSIVIVALMPLILYAGRGIRTRSESVLASACTGIAGALPLFFLHTIFSPGYPEILDAEMPTFWLLENISPDWFIDIYTIILFIMIVQTGVGMMQGFIERMDSWYMQRHGESLSPFRHAMLSGLTLLISLLLSTVGFIDLVRNSYWLLFYCFILVFWIPLMTIGVYKVCKHNDG